MKTRRNAVVNFFRAIVEPEGPSLETLLEDIYTGSDAQRLVRMTTCPTV